MPVLSLRITHDGHPLRPVAFSASLVRIGRDPRCEVFLPDPSVSRIHARIECDGDRYYLVDNGSTNGTLVDGRRVDHEEIVSGSTIKVSAFELMVEVIRSCVDPALGQSAGGSPNEPTIRL